MKHITTFRLRKLDIIGIADKLFGKGSNTMRIKFFTPKTMRGRAKCTVHSNGKLGFSQAAIKRFGINDRYYAKIGINEEDVKDTNLYMLLTQTADEQSFKVNSAGNYYYLNTRNLFDELKIDYKKTKIIYDIEEVKHEGQTIYKLNKRVLDRNK